MKTVTLTELRKDIFRLADQALETGEAVVIERKGRQLELRAKPDAALETRREQWRKFWATPSPLAGQPVLELADFEDLAEWDGEPELDD